MKVAVSSQGRTLDSQVDPRFGRAAYFLLVETETLEFTAIENAGGQGGAGIAAGKIVIDAGAQAVLTGNCGPNAERTLRAGNVRLFTDVTGTVAEAVERFKNGTLVEASGPNVQSHAGTGN
ncbi:MAG: dinitrogenase iron-molybdenum cofactor biosynthesis protein [Planctomycetes bacterium]|nr:dinitrogenase iron-molybdenum cofactor biosynthesis protein [Planctomycetota bacterium]